MRVKNKILHLKKNTEQVGYNRNITAFILILPGTYAVMSVMIGSVTERLAPESDFMTFNDTSNSSSVNISSLNTARVQVAAAVTCLSGLFQVCGPVVLLLGDVQPLSCF